MRYDVISSVAFVLAFFSLAAFVINAARAHLLSRAIARLSRLPLPSGFDYDGEEERRRKRGAHEGNQPIVCPPNDCESSAIQADSSTSSHSDAGTIAVDVAMGVVDGGACGGGE